MLARGQRIGGLNYSLLLSSILYPVSAQVGGREDDEALPRSPAATWRKGEDFPLRYVGSEISGGAAQLHQAIAGGANGGVGPGVSPEKAPELGLKVDINAIPADVAAALGQGRVDLSTRRARSSS